MHKNILEHRKICVPEKLGNYPLIMIGKNLRNLYADI